MENFNYFEELKRSLEDVIAFEAGDTSRCRVLELQKPVPPQIKETALRSGRMRVLSQKRVARQYRNAVRLPKEKSEAIKIKVHQAAEQQG